MNNYIDAVPESIQDFVGAFFADPTTPTEEESTDMTFWDYYHESLAEYDFLTFLQDTGMSEEDYYARKEFEESLDEIIQEELDVLYEDMVTQEELDWYRHARQMGWE